MNMGLMVTEERDVLEAIAEIRASKREVGVEIGEICEGRFMGKRGTI